MTPKKAAALIGNISPQQVRLLIRRGKIKARKVRDHDQPCGYRYNVSEDAALYARDHRQPKGRPRAGVDNGS